MAQASIDQIESWHAHVYFDGDSRDRAAALYEVVKQRFPNADIGRFHEKPVGPHPMWSYQVAFMPDALTEIVSWFALNRDGLDVLVHPETGDQMADHRDRALWIGKSHDLILAALG